MLLLGLHATKLLKPVNDDMETHGLGPFYVYRPMRVSNTRPVFPAGHRDCTRLHPIQFKSATSTPSASFLPIFLLITTTLNFFFFLYYEDDNIKEEEEKKKI
jgi:hypothetical protein